MPKRSDIKCVLIIGAGPIVIDQACEFDYSGVQACKALKEEGYRVVLGIHEVYGEVYRQLSFDTLLSQKRYRASHEALFHCVMARIANPPRARQAQARQRAAPGAGLMRFFVLRESLSDDGSAGR